jgi:hypothetical protein
MGGTSGIQFNWWNVMEYSIGFCGGAGMAYGVFTNASWPEEMVQPDKMSNKFGWVSIIALIPATVLFEGAGLKAMSATYKQFGGIDPAATAFNWQIVLWIMSGIFAIALSWYYSKTISKSPTQAKVSILAIAYLCWYVLISNFVSASWLRPFNSEHLYWVNMLVIFLMIRKHQPLTTSIQTTSYTKPILKYWATSLVVVILLSLVATKYGFARHKEGRWEVKQIEVQQTN